MSRLSELDGSTLLELLRNVADAVFLVEVPQREIFACNPAVKRIFGYDPEELEGRSTKILHVDQEHYQRFDEISLEAISREGAFRGDFEMRRKDGSLIWTEHQVRLYEDPQYEAHFSISTVRDVTRRKEAERLAHHRSEHYESLIAHIEDVIAIVDREGVVRYVSPSARRILEYVPEELVGRPVFENVHPEDQDRIRHVLELTVSAPGRSGRARYRYRRSDGEWIILDTLGTATASGSTIHGIVLTSRDVTDWVEAQEELVRKEQALQHSQRMESLGRLTGGIAHDFNNMLTAILGFSSIASEALDTSHPARSALAEIEFAAGQAAELVNNLLAYSRKQPVRAEVFDLRDEVKAQGAVLGRVLGEDISLQFDLQPGCWVEMDRGQLSQVLINLAVNARDAMQEGGRLSIHVSRFELESDDTVIGDQELDPGEYVRLDVADTGCGIPPEIVDDIFEPFFTTKEAGRGTGLGLSTVYGIVRQSAGHVWVESELGTGTTFHVFLPLRQEGGAAKTRGVTRGKVEQKSSDGRQVIVVEDEQAVRRLIVTVLRSAGYEVRDYPTVERALEAMENMNLETVSVVLTDLVLPGKSGWDLKRWCEEQVPGLPVVIMSGYDKKMGDKTGELILRKPFSREDLLSKLEVALGSCHADRT